MVDYETRGYKTGYGAESSMNTGGTPTTAIGGHVQNVNINKTNNPIQIFAINNRNSVKTLLGAFAVSGQINYILGYDFDFLAHLIGARSGSGTTASPYYLNEDAFGYTSNNIKSFELESSHDKSTDDVEQVTGCILTSASISFAKNSPFTVQTSFLGSNVAHGSLSSITPYSGEVASATELTVVWNSSSLSRVENGIITVANEITEIRDTGSRFVQSYAMGSRIYGFTLVLKMTSDLHSTIYRTHFYGGSSTPDTGLGALTEYDLDIQSYQGATSSDKRFEINLANCHLRDVSKAIPLGSGQVLCTINGFAREGGNTNKPFKYWTVT